MSTVFLVIIMIVILDLVILYWIFSTNKKFIAYQSSESPICPLYFCDQIINPTTEQLQPGSYCYVNTPGQDNLMVAYRYEDSSKTSYQCQKYNISDNVILTDETYLPQSQL